MAVKFQKLEAEYQHLLSEYNIVKCKLECKTDALLILSHELQQSRSERDQYKLMADQLRERYSALKRRVEGWGPSLLGVYDLHGWKGEREQSLVQLLCELKEDNKTLQHEVEDYKEKLSDAQGDIKILRDEASRSRSSSLCDDSLSKQQPICHREDLVKYLEKYKYKYQQLERDLEAVFDEKEELVLARDAFRLKYERLNQQLNNLLRGDQQSYVDIDGVINENRYLQERIKQVLEEKNMNTAALARCKSLLEKKRQSSGLKFSSIMASLSISGKQVEQLLQNNHFFEKSSDVRMTTNDVRNIVLTLLEALSDNTLALSHQKKTNKILGHRVSELEQKVKNFEAATLWQFRDSGRLACLSSIAHSEDALECDERFPDSTKHNCTPIPSDNESDVTQVDGIGSKNIPVVDGSKEHHIKSSFSDLDLLPTKDICPLGFSEHSRCSSESQPCTPTHHAVNHSDSEISPKKKHKSNSGAASSLQNSPVCRKRRQESVTIQDSDDMQDLPPQLQKLLLMALSDIERDNNEQQGNNSDQLTHSPVHDPDPNC